MNTNDGTVLDDYWYTNPLHMSQYINYSKLSITADGSAGNCNVDSNNGISTSVGNRIVGMEITGPTVYGGYGGAISCTNGYACGGGKYFGIYMHNYGQSTNYAYSDDSSTWTSPTSSCYYAPYSGAQARSSVDRFQHLYYITNRTDQPIDGYEIGWNYLTDNPILMGIHIYDMGTVGGWDTSILIHNNVVRNQRGGAIDISRPNSPASAPIYVYDNLLIGEQSSPNSNGMAFRIGGAAPDGIFNNTVYGYQLGSIIDPNTASLGFYNNIIVDTWGVPFFSTNLTTQGNNLFYSTGTTPKPAWATVATGNLNANPLFTNAGSNDFSLQSGSPAAGAGHDTSAVVSRDFLGQLRTMPFSIGAFESVSGSGPPPPDTTPPAAPSGVVVQ